MKKTLLLFILLVGIGLLLPRREQIVSLIAPVGEAAQRRSAQRQLDELAQDIQRAARETGSYPDPAMFVEWLTERNRDSEDPWGSRYYFELHTDSFVVGSPGADARARTNDDLRRAHPRRFLEPGVLIVDHAPPPPPSSASGTAKTKAMEAAKRQ